MAGARPIRSRLVRTLALSVALCACDSGDGDSAVDADTSEDASAAGEDAAEPAPDDASGATADAGAEACPEPSGEGTSHGPFLERDETWSLADSPHELPQGLNISRDVELRVEACAVVRIAASKNIAVDGKLTTLGQAGRPVVFERLDPDAAWGAITSIRRPLPLSLTNTVLEGGGALDGGLPEQHAMIRVEGDANGELWDMLAADALTLRGSESNGIELRSNAAFTRDSRALVIEGSAHYPAISNGWAAGTLPDGDYTGNEIDAILVLTSDRIGIDGLVVEAAWSDLGVPYRIGGETDSELKQLRVGAPMGVASATLSLAAGVELQFTNTAGIAVLGREATLRAIGTASSPIVFTSAQENTAAGDWLGIQFNDTVSDMNAIEYARIWYAGNPETRTSGYSCGTPKASAAERGRTMGGVYFSLREGAPTNFITGTEFRWSASNGIDRGWTGETVDLAAGNSFRDIAFCTQTEPQPETGSCGDPPECPEAGG